MSSCGICGTSTGGYVPLCQKCSEEMTVTKEAWSEIKADLLITVTANGAVIAQTTDTALWAQIVRMIGDNSK